MPGVSYLIDYENVHENGLAGIECLSEEDCVFIFFTDNANKLTLDYLVDIRVPFVVKKVANGKQSLDMHLVSYLGYLMGCEEGQSDRRYVIISHDSDFDGVCEFWNHQYGMEGKVTRQSFLYVDDDPMDEPEPYGIPPKLKPLHPVLKSRMESIIVTTIRRHGQKERNNVYAIRLSMLCAELNNDPTYQECRSATGRKAQHMLEAYFASVVTVQARESNIWVYDVPNMYLMDKQRKAAANAAAEPEAPIPSPLEEAVEEPPASPAEPSAEPETEDVEAEVPAPADQLPGDMEDPFLLEEIPDMQMEAAEYLPEEAEPDASLSPPASIPEETDPLKEERHRLISESLLAGGMDAEDVPVVSDYVTMMIGDQTGKRAIYQTMLTSFGRKHGLKLYAILRETMEKLELPGENCFAKKKKTR